MPEPYFIHKEIINNTIDLHAVFININPSEPKFYHLNNKGRVHKDFSKIFQMKKQMEMQKVIHLMLWIGLKYIMTKSNTQNLLVN